MHNKNDRPVKYTKKLAFIREKTYRYLFQLFLTPGVRLCVCLSVHTCVSERERIDECVCVCVHVCRKELFGLGYYSLAI